MTTTKTQTEIQTENLEFLSSMAASATARIVDVVTGEIDRKELQTARDAVAGMVLILKTREVDCVAGWMEIVEAHMEAIG